MELETARIMPKLSLPFLLVLLPFLVFLSGCSGEQRLQPLPASQVVLAFGDSLTYGKGASRSDSYPAALERMINRKVVNAGINGELSADGLKRLPGLLQQHNPSLVILTHGGNDLLRRLNLERTADNLRTMIQLSRDAGADVVMMGVPRPGIFLSTAEFYETVAMELNVPIELDVIADVLQDPANKSDAVHPNSTGYRQMAEALKDLLDAEGAI